MITTINDALAKSRLKREEGEKGFTLIELLVVVVIIGILAAIAIPVFLNQREAAWKSSVESDLKNAATAVETYAANNNGKYPTASNVVLHGPAAAPITGVNFKGSADNTIRITSTASSYTITGTNSNFSNTNTRNTWSSASGGLTGWVTTTP